MPCAYFVVFLVLRTRCRWFLQDRRAAVEDARVWLHLCRLHRALCLPLLRALLCLRLSSHRRCRVYQQRCGNGVAWRGLLSCPKSGRLAALFPTTLSHPFPLLGRFALFLRRRFVRTPFSLPTCTGAPCRCEHGALAPGFSCSRSSPWHRWSQTLPSLSLVRCCAGHRACVPR